MGALLVPHYLSSRCAAVNCRALALYLRFIVVLILPQPSSTTWSAAAFGDHVNIMALPVSRRPRFRTRRQALCSPELRVVCVVCFVLGPDNRFPKILASCLHPPAIPGYWAEEVVSLLKSGAGQPGFTRPKLCIVSGYPDGLAPYERSEISKECLRPANQHSRDWQVGGCVLVRLALIVTLVLPCL